MKSKIFDFINKYFIPRYYLSFYQLYAHNYYNLLKKYNKDFKNDIIFLISFYS